MVSVTVVGCYRVDAQLFLALVCFEGFAGKRNKLTDSGFKKHHQDKDGGAQYLSASVLYGGGGGHLCAGVDRGTVIVHTVS